MNHIEKDELRTRVAAIHTATIVRVEAPVGGFNWTCTCGDRGTPTAKHPHSQKATEAAHARHVRNAQNRVVARAVRADRREAALLGLARRESA